MYIHENKPNISNYQIYTVNILSSTRPVERYSGTSATFSPFYWHVPTIQEDYMAENRGNFANDRERASQAGQKGGQSTQGGSGSRQGTQSSGKTGQQTGGQHSGGNFANDPQRASEAGRKGGEHSGGGHR
jgi:general stress protein YciG